MRAALSGALLLLPLVPALAQAPSPAPAQEGTPMRLRGTVERLDGSTLRVKTRTGQDVSMTLAPTLAVSGVVRKSLSDIKAGDYVASTSVRGTDGKLRAIEVHFLSPTATEGQFPADLVPNSLMTNAIVSGISAAPDGQVLKVTYKGGQSEITVPPDVPVVASTPGDASLLKPGAAVLVSVLRKPDGSLTAVRATVEKDGVKPPM